MQEEKEKAAIEDACLGLGETLPAPCRGALAGPGQEQANKSQAPQDGATLVDQRALATTHTWGLGER